MKVLRPRDLFTSLKRPGRLLGFDAGIKNVGVAVSNENYTFAAPYGVIKRREDQPHLLAQEVLKIATHLNVRNFVIGNPLLKGKIDPSVKHVPGFIQDLLWSELFRDFQYTHWDESLTSRAVKELMNPVKFGRTENKRHSDMYAATGITQDFLDAGQRYMEHMAKLKEDSR